MPFGKPKYHNRHLNLRKKSIQRTRIHCTRKSSKEKEEAEARSNLKVLHREGVVVIKPPQEYVVPATDIEYLKSRILNEQHLHFVYDRFTRSVFSYYSSRTSLSHE